MHTQPHWGDQRAGADVGTIGGPTIKVYRDTERRAYCTTGSHTFHADRGTFFETVRTDRPVMLNVVAMLVERHSLRAIGRIKRCQLDTVRHWLDRADQQAATVSHHCMRGLHGAQAQIDELWTCITKNRNTFTRVIPMI
jgi:hypothetical protein